MNETREHIEQFNKRSKRTETAAEKVDINTAITHTVKFKVITLRRIFVKVA